MNMQTEPIRLPAWAASLLTVVVLPAVSSLLLGADYKTVLVGAIAAILPLLGAAEIARSKVSSPATVDSQVRLAELAASAPLKVHPNRPIKVRD